MTAPDRIYISAPDLPRLIEHGLVTTEPEPDSVSFVRADIVDELAHLLYIIESQLMASSDLAFDRGTPLLYQETASKARSARTIINKGARTWQSVRVKWRWRRRLYRLGQRSGQTGA